MVGGHREAMGHGQGGAIASFALISRKIYVVSSKKKICNIGLINILIPTFKMNSEILFRLQTQEMTLASSV